MDRKELMRLLRALSESPYPSIQQICMAQASDEIDGLQREILRCDDACYKRDQEIAELRRQTPVATIDRTEKA